jgi:hypothetical protein
MSNVEAQKAYTRQTTAKIPNPARDATKSHFFHPPRTRGFLFVERRERFFGTAEMNLESAGKEKQIGNQSPVFHSAPLSCSDL